MPASAAARSSEPNRPSVSWPFALLPVAPLQVARDLLVVAGERLVGVVRDAFFQNLEVEHADQAVAELDVVVEEGERAAGVVALDPERHLAEVDRERVTVDRVEAVADHVADRGALRLGRGLRLAGAHPRQLLADPPELRRAGSAPSPPPGRPP